MDPFALFCDAVDEDVALVFVVDDGVDGGIIHHGVADGIAVYVKVLIEEEPALSGLVLEIAYHELLHVSIQSVVNLLVGLQEDAEAWG